MPQRVPHDRRWAAVCFSIFTSARSTYINPELYNIFAEGMNTAAIFQETHENILRGRALLAIINVKSDFVIGCGEALGSQERRLISRQHNLMSRSDEAEGEVSSRGFSCTLY